MVINDTKEINECNMEYLGNKLKVSVPGRTLQEGARATQVCRMSFGESQGDRALGRGETLGFEAEQTWCVKKQKGEECGISQMCP